MGLVQDCFEFLKKEGYAPELSDKGNLFFKYQGLTYVIPDNGEDTYFLKVDVNFEKDVFPGTRAQLLEAAVKVAEERKVVKSYIDLENEVSFAAEILLGEGYNVAHVLPRLLDMLRECPGFFDYQLSQIRGDQPAQNDTLLS